MSFLFDNALAAIVAAGLLLLLLTTVTNRSRADIQHTLEYAEARRAEAVLHVMAADVASADSLTRLSPTDRRFSFVARPDPVTGAARAVEYRLVQVPGATTEYVAERYVDGALTMKSASLLGWEIQLLDAGGASVGALLDARVVRLRLMTPRADGRPGVGRRWEATVAPPLLSDGTF